MRFLRKLFGASEQSAFVNFIYQVSGPLVAFFDGHFWKRRIDDKQLETADLVAIVVYAVIGWGLVMLIRIITAPRGHKPAMSSFTNANQQPGQQQEQLVRRCWSPNLR